MKKTVMWLLCGISFTGITQEFSTPNLGVNWSLEDVLQNSEGVVSFEDNVYTISQDILVAQNDTLTLSVNQNILMDEDVLLTVEGTFLSLGQPESLVTINASDSLTPYKGFRFTEESTVKINATVINNGGGLKAITPNFEMTNSFLSYNHSGVSTGGVVSFSYGSPLVQGNSFTENDLPAVSSPANRMVSARIIDNVIYGNGQANLNRPQINMGTTGLDTLKIIGNLITGDRNLNMVGGIGISNFTGGDIVAVIEGNTITDNRYGITVAGGNAYVEIVDNMIEDNDTQGDPMLGGSGISVNSTVDSQHIIAKLNSIRGNLWGITIIDKASMNLGDDEDNEGGNVFADNGNGGVVYALYNNSTSMILAKHNCWIEGGDPTLEEVAEVIVDVADDATLGEVIYDPINCGVLSLNENKEQEKITIYPNPVQDVFTVLNPSGLKKAQIYSLDGRLVATHSLVKGVNRIACDLGAGVYLINFDDVKIEKIVVR